MGLDEDLHDQPMDPRLFSDCVRPGTQLLCPLCAFGCFMESGDDSLPAPSPSPEGRPLFPRSPPARSPEHELRDRTKAAKLRHKAAKARMKATRMTERAHKLNEKAGHWERRANELDGVVSVLSQTPGNG